MTSTPAILAPSTGGLLLAVFGVAWIALGIYWGRRARSLDGYLLAGRNVGFALGTATAMATWVTSNTVMLAPVFALEKGIWGMLAYATASFGLFLFAPLALRIRRLMPRGYTSGDFIRLRFGHPAWGLFLVITLVYSMAWLVSMGIAGGKLLETLAGVPFVHGMSAILFVCVVYTLFGGMYAVIGTDFIQSLIILAGILVVGGAVISKVDLCDVIGSVQTIHLSSDRPWAIARLGKERIESGAYVWRDMLNAGVHLANGSDVPVEPINPIANFYAAVTRKTLSGTPENGFEAAQRLSRQEALASLTRWNAYAGFQEESLGSIKVGKRADLTITNQDLMSVAEDELLATTIAMTIIDGEIVFSAP